MEPGIHKPSSTATTVIDENAPVRVRSALRDSLGDAALGPLQEVGLGGLRWLRKLCREMEKFLSNRSLVAVIFIRVKTQKAFTNGIIEESEFRRNLQKHRFDNVGDIDDRKERWKT